MNRWRYCLIHSAPSRLVIGRLAMLQLILLLPFCTRVQPHLAAEAPTREEMPLLQAHFLSLGHSISMGRIVCGCDLGEIVRVHWLSVPADSGFLKASFRDDKAAVAVKTFVEWKSSEARFICPCHSSVFDITGNVLSPAAPRALNFHPVMIDDGMVKVNTGKWMQRKRSGKSQAASA